MMFPLPGATVMTPSLTDHSAGLLPLVLTQPVMSLPLNITIEPCGGLAPTLLSLGVSSSGGSRPRVNSARERKVMVGQAPGAGEGPHGGDECSKLVTQQPPAG